MRDLVDGGAAVDFQDALHSGRASQLHIRGRAAAAQRWLVH